MTFFGSCATDSLGGHRINPIWARRQLELWGAGAIIRYSPQWNDLGTDPISLDFQQLDDDIGVLTEAGLSVYLNLNGVAQYACGSTCYLEGVEGCLDWIDPSDGTKGLKFTPERGDCSKPPDPNPAAISDVASQLVTRYPNLTMISFGNEPDDRISSPAIMNQTEIRYGGDWSKTAEWVTERFLLPFADGVPLHINTRIAGGEFSTPGFMAASLRYQKTVRTGFEHSRYAWDWRSTTIHLYAGGGQFPDDTYAQLDAPGGILAYVNELRERDGIDVGRIIISETGRQHGEDPSGWLSLLPRLWERQDVVKSVIVLTDDWFTPESVRDSDPMKNTYEPSELYAQMQRCVQQLTGRHRAVSK